MIFTGIEFAGDIPFTDVYIHSTIQAADGRRMSKSLGTGIDPLDLIDRYGADATRYGLLKMCSTQDVRFAEGMIDEGRSFTNKLWNASRLVLLGADPDAGRGADRRRADRPLDPDAAERGDARRRRRSTRRSSSRTSSRSCTASSGTTSATGTSRRSRSASTATTEARRQASETALFVLERVLGLLHPVMPFVTEEIWPYLPGRARAADAVAVPGAPTSPEDPEAARAVSAVIELVTELRRMRQDAGLGPREPLELAVSGGADAAHLRAQRDLLAGLGRATIVDGDRRRRAGRGRRRPRAGRRRRARRRAPRQARAPRSPRPRADLRQGGGEARQRGLRRPRAGGRGGRGARARRASRPRGRGPRARAWPSWRGRWPGSRTCSRPAPRSACGSGSTACGCCSPRSASRSGRSARSTSSAPTARPRRRCSPPRSSRRTASSPARTSRRTCTGSRERVQVARRAARRGRAGRRRGAGGGRGGRGRRDGRRAADAVRGADGGGVRGPRRAGAEVVVVEAGLGGRYDATNVLDAPVVALTNVGLDHTEQLGGTREAIAAEKLAVVAPGADLVAGSVDDGARARHPPALPGTPARCGCCGRAPTCATRRRWPRAAASSARTWRWRWSRASCCWATSFDRARAIAAAARVVVPGRLQAIGTRSAGARRRRPQPAWRQGSRRRAARRDRRTAGRWWA